MKFEKPWQKVFHRVIEDAAFVRLSPRAHGLLFVLRLLAARADAGGAILGEDGKPLGKAGVLALLVLVANTS